MQGSSCPNELGGAQATIHLSTAVLGTNEQKPPEHPVAAAGLNEVSGLRMPDAEPDCEVLLTPLPAPNSLHWVLGEIKVLQRAASGGAGCPLGACKRKHAAPHNWRWHAGEVKRGDYRHLRRSPASAVDVGGAAGLARRRRGGSEGGVGSRAAGQGGARVQGQVGHAADDHGKVGRGRERGGCGSADIAQCPAHAGASPIQRPRPARVRVVGGAFSRHSIAALHTATARRSPVGHGSVAPGVAVCGCGAARGAGVGGLVDGAQLGCLARGPGVQVDGDRVGRGASQEATSVFCYVQPPPFGAEKLAVFFSRDGS